MEEIKVTGQVSIKGYDEHGNEVLTVDKNNLVVNVGKGVLVTMLRSGSSTLLANGVGFGTNGATPTLADTALTAGFVKAISSNTSPQPNQAQFNWALEYGENNGMTIRELGLICDRLGAAVLFARLTTDPIVKTSSLRLEGSWRITF